MHEGSDSTATSGQARADPQISHILVCRELEAVVVAVIVVSVAAVSGVVFNVQSTAKFTSD